MSDKLVINDPIEHRIALVKSNFKNLTADKATFAKTFYKRLFSMAPQLKPLFEGTPMHKQGAKMHAALVLLVENLRNPESLREVLGPLGERHKTYGATAQNYKMFGVALIETLKEFSSEDWTEEVEEAWTQTNDMVIRLMLEGAGEKTDTPIEISDMPDKALAPMPSHSDPLERRISLIKSNFKNLKANKTDFADSFYSRLFETSPQLKPLFEGTPMKSQGAKLHAALVLLVENLRNPAALRQVLEPLGAKHKGYGATPQTYPMIGSALLETLEEHSGDDWTEEVKDAWDKTFKNVTGIMLKGAGNDTSIAAEAVQAPRKAQSKPQITAKQINVQKNSGNPNRLTVWFFDVPVWKLILIGVCFALVLIPLGKVFPPVQDFIDFAEPLSIFIALLLFIREMPERKKQFHYQAWGAIDAAQGIKSSHARFIALQDLCDDGVSLKGLDLDGADLSGIEMNGVDLSASSFRSAALKNASLRAANLNHADFERAIITGAKFDGTNCSFVKFAEANLSSADFSEANMIFADLSKANLSGANLTNAKLNGAKFEGAYMSGADLRGADITVEEMAGAFLTGAIMPDGKIHA